MIVASITLTAPTGSAWEFLLLFAVVIVGPPIIQRARIPGLIGLLLGGFVIGPHGFGLIPAGSTTIPDLGQLGLLYLMFVAGVEIDLALLRRHRRSAVVFSALTFSFPMVFGTIVGQALGWSVSASLLLGSLLASHTLVLYPMVARAGLGKDAMIASAVGATVLTDTLTLVILAVIAGTSSGTGSTAEIIVTIVIGLAVLVIVCFVVVPLLARRAFRIFGSDRTVRYVIAVEAFLIAAVVAETFGIEGIVGRVLRRAGAQPPGAQRRPIDGPHRLLRLGRVHPRVPRVRRTAAEPVGDDPARHPRTGGAVHPRVHRRQADRILARPAAARRQPRRVVADVGAHDPTGRRDTRGDDRRLRDRTV